MNPLSSHPLDTKTKLYGVIGHPVAHSLGPAMHNRAFSETGINAVYLAFDVVDPASAIGGIRSLSIAGMSVTVPHKTAVMAFLDEIDDTAAAIGAVNTIVNTEGRLTGYNTDAFGAIAALEEHTGSLSGKKILILGAGGAARAVGYGALQKGAEVHIANRTPEKGEKLAAQLNASFCPLSDAGHLAVDILVNTTPAGMHPNTDDIPVSPDILRPEMLVMDIIYNPLTTRLLSEAKKRGCTAIDGVSMFVNQGARQFHLFTGIQPPVESMKRIVYQSLK